MGNLAEIVNIQQGRRYMPSKNGYVSLWRDIQKQEWYKDSQAVHLFIHLMTTATQKDKKTVFKNVEISLNPGQLYLTYPMLEKHTGITKEKARRLLNKFKKLNQITVKPLKKQGLDLGQLVTILNWEKWQKSDTLTDTLPDTLSVAEIKALNGYADTLPDTLPDTQNNNVYNNNTIVSKDTCISQSEKREQMPNGFYQSIADLYNETFPELPSCKTLSPARKKSIKARTLNEFKNIPTAWNRYFDYIRNSCEWMLSGNYNINFDYLIRQKNVIQIMEGAKNDRK